MLVLLFFKGFFRIFKIRVNIVYRLFPHLCVMNKGLLNGVLFLDLKKTFDTVDHQILNLKLKFYGIEGVALNLFKSYISNRMQRRTIQEIDSQPNIITCGVPEFSF